MTSFIDCHAHVFNTLHVPDKFFGMKLTWTQKCLAWLSGNLSAAIPGSKDILENVANFSRHFGQSMEANLIELLSFYPEGSRVCLLTMDFSQVRGGSYYNFDEQCEQMLALKRKYPDRVLLFLFIDPVCTAAVQARYTRYLATGLFDGVKVYPPLNACPTRPEFDWLWTACQLNKIPVIAHCCEAGVSAPTFWNIWKGTFAHPKHWRQVLQKYPYLYLNLAHFGLLNVSWQREIVDLCVNYANVYTDTSFMVGNKEAVALLKYWLVREPTLIDKVLFGSDYYMTDLLNSNLAQLIYDLRATLNHERFAQITTINPARFLRLPG